METKEQYLCDLILVIVSDDYESFAYIEERLRSQFDPNSDNQPSKDQIAKAIEELERSGEIAAYVLDAAKPNAERVLLSEGNLEKLWFYATGSGSQRAKVLARGKPLEQDS